MTPASHKDVDDIIYLVPIYRMMMRIKSATPKIVSVVWLGNGSNAVRKKSGSANGLTECESSSSSNNNETGRGIENGKGRESERHLHQEIIGEKGVTKETGLAPGYRGQDLSR